MAISRIIGYLFWMSRSLPSDMEHKRRAWTMIGFTEKESRCKSIVEGCHTYYSFGIPSIYSVFLFWFALIKGRDLDCFL